MPGSARQARVATPRTYHRKAGFCVYFDYAGGLEPEANGWTLSYTFMQGTKKLSKANLLFAESIAGGTPGLRVAVFPRDASFHVTDCPAQEQLCLLVALYEDEEPGPNATPVGWSKLQLFGQQGHLCRGPQRLPLRRAPVDEARPRGQVLKLPKAGDATVYLRVLAGDEAESVAPRGEETSELHLQYAVVENRHVVSSPISDGGSGSVAMQASDSGRHPVSSNNPADPSSHGAPEAASQRYVALVARQAKHLAQPGIAP